MRIVWKPIKRERRRRRRRRRRRAAAVGGMAHVDLAEPG
jgi:CelD/BcsL family acetyltransferase involved in cellulose biosynthesis